MAMVEKTAGREQATTAVAGLQMGPATPFGPSHHGPRSMPPPPAMLGRGDLASGVVSGRQADACKQASLARRLYLAVHSRLEKEGLLEPLYQVGRGREGGAAPYVLAA